MITVAGPAPVKSLSRGLQMLEDLVLSEQPLRLRDFARKYGVDRASAYRLLGTLQALGFAAKDAATKTWTTGSKLDGWLAAARWRFRLIDVVRPSLERLVAETGESGHVAVLRGEHALLVDYLASGGVVTVTNRVGVEEPLYCTAVGKAILAHLPDARRDALLARTTLRRHTPRTVTTPAALAQQLARVRREGIAVDLGEYHDVLMCVGAPLLGRGDEVLGSLGVSMVRALHEPGRDRLRRITAAVRRAAAEASHALGGHPPARAEVSRRESRGPGPGSRSRRR